jgi:uncharacterized protein YdeI (YjbR/CyaY-like superfamily)
MLVPCLSHVQGHKGIAGIDDGFQRLEITSVDELRRWLGDNCCQNEGIWLVIWKKSVPDKYFSREDVLDQLLCFGWIDGRRAKVDEHRSMQYVSPRRAQHWAASYKKRVEVLRENGLMHEAGEASILKSKELGLWNFMDDVDKLIIPPDLKNTLKEDQRAREFFESINPSSKRFALRWLRLSKTEKTRKNRIQRLFDLSKKGEKLPGS